jgi:hypothetical protein
VGGGQLQLQPAQRLLLALAGDVVLDVAGDRRRTAAPSSPPGSPAGSPGVRRRAPPAPATPGGAQVVGGAPQLVIDASAWASPRSPPAALASSETRRARSANASSLQAAPPAPTRPPCRIPTRSPAPTPRGSC